MHTVIKRILSLFSNKRRKQALWISFSVLLRSLLDFVGVAALVPVIFLIARKLGSDQRIILLLCVAVMVFVAVKNAIVYFLTRRQIKFQTEVYNEFSRRMYINYYRRGMTFLKSKSSVQLAYEVNGIAMIFSQNVMGSLLGMAGEIALILMMSIALVIWKPLMGGLIFLIFVPAAFAYSSSIRKKIRNIGNESIKAQRAQSRNVTETFRGYAELEIAGAFNSSLAAFDRNMAKITRNRLALDLYRLMPTFISEIGFVAALMALVAFGGSDPLFTGGVFAMAAFRIIPSLRGALNHWAMFQNNAFSIEVVENGLEVKDDARYEDNGKTVEFLKGLELKNLGFSFPDGKQLFKNLSFTILPGERLGIKGKSGTGKSTLFNLVLGFLTPSEGQIILDGEQLQGENRRAWHKTVGYVPQEIFIVDGSLAQNVTLGIENIDREKVLKVLDQVKLKDWALALPEGIDTNLGEYGNRISGGQKQRIGIARALYKGARVLFFDEATSSLDSVTENEINKALEELSENHRELTLIIISHRESSLGFCDRIIDLDQYKCETE